VTLVACVVRRPEAVSIRAPVSVVDTIVTVRDFVPEFTPSFIFVNISHEYNYRHAVLTFSRARFQRFSALGKALGTLGTQALPRQLLCEFGHRPKLVE